MVTLKAKKKSEKETIKILDLAVSCKLITLEQEKKILNDIVNDPEKDHKASVFQILYKRNILDKDQITFLMAVKRHLDTLMLDKKFGKIGVANNFVPQKAVDRALDIQIDVFKRDQKSLKIGDILVLKKDISEADRTAILLTQDRIRDNYLAEAFNAIAKDEMERSAINQRFGAIAVKKELITTEQLNKALKIQKNEEKKTGEKTYLGEILKKQFKLSEKNKIKVLRIQKRLEVKRMNLQKRVFTFNAQRASVKILDQFFSIEVTEDKTNAFIIVKKEKSPKCDISDIFNWLTDSGIRHGICPEKDITAFFDSPVPGNRLNIAQATLPVESKPEQIQYRFDLPENSSDAQSEKSAVTVQKDEVIATVIPFEPGTPGKDVFGHIISDDQNQTVTLTSGKGVARRGNDFIALIEGIPQVYKGRTLFVVPEEPEIEKKEIQGDFTAEATDDYKNCDLNVSGNISQGASVSCNGLKVKGDVLGNITAVGDVEIQGSVGSSDPLESGMPPVQINTQGKLNVKGETICAHVVADKGITAPNTSVINSEIISSGDVDVKNILSDKNAPTVIQIAMKHTVELEKLDQLIAAKETELEKWTFKSELKHLSTELMKHVQAQQDYLEKQNVLVYLEKIMAHPELRDIESLEDKIAAYEKRNENHRQEKIPENTKAHKFLIKMVNKMASIEPKEHQRFVDELLESIINYYKSAVKATHRINKKYEGKCKQAEKETKTHETEIREKETQISELIAQKDYLNHAEKQKGNDDQLFIRVKNELGEYTVIKGKEAQLITEKPIHGVFIRERQATDDEKAEMLIQGSFEE